MLRELRAGCRVSYLALDDGSASSNEVDAAAEYCDALWRVPMRTAKKGTAAFYGELARNLMSTLPYAAWKYRSPEMRDAIRDLVRGEAIDLIVCDFLAPAVNLPDDLPVPTVLFQHNVEARIWERHAEVATHPLRRQYFEAQWLRMQAFERAQCRRVDHVVAVSADDLAYFHDEYGVQSVSAVATGVDTDFFRPAAADGADPNSIVFTGSMDWMPNEDAVRWFTGEILPRIRDEMPNARLEIVGRNPTADVQALAEQTDVVQVTGTVADVRPYLERAAVVVVPLRIGGGTRLKIFEAMAMEKAIVSTTIGAEGLPIVDGKHLLLADTVDGFASSVVRLMRETTLARQIGAQANRLVRSRFGWKGVAAEFIGMLQGVHARFTKRDPLAAVTP